MPARAQGTPQERELANAGLVRDASYRSYVIRVRASAPSGAVRVEIEQVLSGIETVIHGRPAQRVVAAIEAALVTSVESGRADLGGRERRMPERDGGTIR